MRPDDALIDYRADRAVATITLDDPDRRNALSTALIGRFRASLSRAVADDDIRLVVIDHAGPVFCAGADLGESARAERTEDLPAAHLAEALADIVEAPKPVVAIARGAVRGGGMGLLAAADIAIAGTGVRLAFSEVLLGVVPAVIAPVVARKLTDGKMRELFLTGEAFGAEEARCWGLTAYASDEPDAVLEGVVERLKAGGPAAQAGIKQLTGDAALRADLRAAADLTAEYFFSEQGREGVRSFIEKASPSWVH
ncbi:Clp protease/crotonase-like domain-containing protein [Glycomyces tarimensis]